MKSLLTEYLPHAPDHGLFIAPDIPSDKLRAAIGDYASGVSADEVIALFDATRLGNAKDGILFLADRLVFQNHDLSEPRAIHYKNIVGIRSKKSFLGARTVEVDVNRGRATVTESLDLTAHPGAVDYVLRCLEEIFRADTSATSDVSRPNIEAVRAVLEPLVGEGVMTERQLRRMLDVLNDAV